MIDHNSLFRTDDSVIEFLEVSTVYDAENSGRPGYDSSGAVIQVISLLKLDTTTLFNLVGDPIPEEFFQQHGLRIYRDYIKVLEDKGAKFHDGKDAQGDVVAAHRVYWAKDLASLDSGDKIAQALNYYRDGDPQNPDSTTPAKQQFNKDGALVSVGYLEAGVVKDPASGEPAQQWFDNGIVSKAVRASNSELTQNELVALNLQKGLLKMPLLPASMIALRSKLTPAPC